MSSSGSLSLLTTGGASSFTSPFLPSLGSYRSPPRSDVSDESDDSDDDHYDYPTIEIAHLSKIIDASLVLKGMASSDDEQKLEASHHQQQLSPNRLSLSVSPAKSEGSRNNSPSPGTATASSIAAMSLSFIINDDNSENKPENRKSPPKQNEYRFGPIEDSKQFVPLRQAVFPDSPLLVPLPRVSSSHAASSSQSPGFGVSAILNTVCAKPDCYRTIRGPPGSFCKYHKQSRFCRAENCNKSAKTGGYCISHGGGKRCSFESCTKSAKQGGLCISHGGGKRCSENGCTKSALVGGFCSAHGGGRKCKTGDCNKTALLGGYCIAHGGGKRCQVDGCSKSAVGGHLCVSHGGGKRCQADGCNKGAVRNGVCIRHGAKRDGASSSNASGSPSPVKSIKAECEYSP